jgi:hypothetical protein
MLWYKSWLETRWRLLIGLALLSCSAAAAVFTYPYVAKLIPMVPTDIGGEIGRQIREAAELSRTYGGYVWSHWYRDNLLHMGILFAILLGTASLISPSRGALFTLSLPVSRRKLAGVRAATGLAELFILSLIPSLLISLLSPAIGQSYGIVQTIIHSVCLFVAASVFFGFAFLLSTVFSDPWRPLLTALAVAFALALFDRVPELGTYSVFRVMSGESYFRDGQVPWLGLLASAAISAALHYGAMLHFARRDF